MEISSILYIIEDAYFDRWLNKIAKTDEGNHHKTMLECEKLLKEKVADKNKEILNKYICSADCYYEIRLFEMCEKVLHEGIKIGMDIQKIISEQIN